jgi:saccharopine dehydrogenase-like NADP-dependent oxidoreductase
MSAKHKIFIAGAGGIGRAAALLLREMGDFTIDIWMGDIKAESASEASQWVLEDSNRPGKVTPVTMPASGTSDAMTAALQECHILLDCLPGSQAPRMAKLCLEHGLHYVNLTEYVAETEEIVRIAQGAEKAFILQSGLAPGYIGILANYLYNNFVADFGVEVVEYISMKVGALTQHALPPHYYGYTWSPIGVATEYVKPAIVIRNFEKTTRSSLSQRETLIIRGETYEADLTSGGAADLPDAFAGKARNLDYKTIRYPGHYAWVDAQLRDLPETEERPTILDNLMQANIPLVEDDIVLIYASVEGKDKQGRLQRKDRAFKIYPMKVGHKTLRAIQTTTAAPMVECARMLMFGHDMKGIVLQSMIDPESFLNGLFVRSVYGGVREQQ